MIFTPLALAGAYVIEVKPRSDERGFLTRTFCQDEFAAHGLNTTWVQHSTVFSVKAGTLRGMHYQKPPHAEVKLLRCTAGAVYDVIIDLRPESLTFKRWFGTELSAANRRMIYIPDGFAHGAQTLQDHTELFYQMSAFYQPEAVAGVRWDDPAFGIRWPADTRMISERDQTYSDYEG